MPAENPFARKQIAGSSGILPKRGEGRLGGSTLPIKRRGLAENPFARDLNTQHSKMQVTTVLPKKQKTLVNPAIAPEPPVDIRIEAASVRETKKTSQTDTECPSNIASRIATDTAPVKEREVCVSQLPLDWQPKLRGKVLTREPLEWVETAMQAELPRAINESNLNRGLSWDTSRDSALHRFARACIYWAHPTCHPLPPATLDLHIDSCSELAMRRQTEWRQAYQSAYEALCHNCSEGFHLIYKDFNVVFQASADAERCGFVTRTSKGLRHKLQQEGVDFACVSTNDGSTMRLLSARDFAGLQDKATKRSTDGLVAPVVCRGASEVERLYCFFRDGYRAPFMTDVPQIFSSWTFVNATLNILELKVQSKVELGQGKGTSNQLSIQGVVLPTAFQDLCASLSVLQQGQLALWWSAYPNCEQLNRIVNATHVQDADKSKRSDTPVQGPSKMAVSMSKMRYDASGTWITLPTKIAQTFEQCRI